MYDVRCSLLLLLYRYVKIVFVLVGIIFFLILLVGIWVEFDMAAHLLLLLFETRFFPVHHTHKHGPVCVYVRARSFVVVVNAMSV